MTHQKNKITEEYKRQKIFPNTIGRPIRELTADNGKTGAKPDNWMRTCPSESKTMNLRERMELISLREENHRMLKEIDILVKTISIMGSKMDK